VLNHRHRMSLSQAENSTTLTIVGFGSKPALTAIPSADGQGRPQAKVTDSSQSMEYSLQSRRLSTAAGVDVPSRSVTGAQTAGPGALNANAKNAATARKKNATT
jgi:hypothetical protein